MIFLQETRMIMAALVQHISYDEFLPVLLGKEQTAKFGLSIGEVSNLNLILSAFH
jgi:hypothetical protein